MCIYSLVRENRPMVDKYIKYMSHVMNTYVRQGGFHEQGIGNKIGGWGRVMYLDPCKHLRVPGQTLIGLKLSVSALGK